MVPLFRRAHHNLVGLDLNYFSECDFGPRAEAIPAIRKDIRDLDENDLRGFDAVVHLAALSNDPMGELIPELTLDINYRASVKLARLAKAAGVKRFLYSSSCSIYGAAGDQVMSENAPLKPMTAYAESKVRAEEEISALAGEGFSPVFLRNATAYGASPRFRADLVLNNLTCWAFTTKAIRIMSDGTPWRPIVHIEDIARAFLAALAAPVEKIHDQAFNVGLDAENYRVRDIAEIVKHVIPGCTVEYAGKGGFDPRSYRVDFGKIARALPDFQPKWNVGMGVEEVYAGFQRNGLSLEDFQGWRFTRLGQLRRLIDSGRLDASLRWRQVETTAAGSSAA